MNNKDKIWYLYIVECSDNSLYTGITTDVTRRINEHNNNKGAKYTKGKGPVILKYLTFFKNRSESSKEESRIKKLSRSQKLELINDISEFKKNLINDWGKPDVFGPWTNDKPNKDGLLPMYQSLYLISYNDGSPVIETLSK